MKKFTVAVAGLFAALACAPAANATTTPEPVVCDGTIANQIVGDVTVKYAQNCTLSQVIVLGDVIGRSYAGAISLDRVTVRGSVRAPLSESLTINSSAVGEDVASSESYGESGVKIVRSAVAGTVTVNYATGPVALGDHSAIGGAVALVGNYAGGTVTRSVFGAELTVNGNSGAFTLNRNVVRGTLNCEQNDPVPSGANNLAGQKLGQCAAL